MITPLDLPTPEVHRLDQELVRRMRARCRDRLELGLALAALGSRHKELGFRTFGSYVKERASQKPRWCSDTRALARRLRERPAMLRALWRAEINWCVAELLARHSTPEDEAELLEAARGMTVRELRAALSEKGEAAEAEESPKVTIDLPVANPAEVLALEATKRAVIHMNGGEAEHWFDCLVAEAASTMPDMFMQEMPDPRPALERARLLREEAAERRAAMEAQATPVAVPLPPEDVEVELPDFEGMSPNELDAVIVERSKRLGSGDVWFGRMLDRFLRARGWARLGYASEQHWFDERLGMARSTGRHRVTMARRMEWLEGLDVAVQDGHLGYEHAALVARVATPDTLEAWIERAEKRTHKHLREEVQAMELVAAANGDPRVDMMPPSDEELELVFDFERQALSGELLADKVRQPTEPGEVDPIQMSVTSGEGEPEPDEPPIQMSVTFRKGTRLSVRVDEETALHYRQLEALWRDTGSPGSFWFFACAAFWRYWGHRFSDGSKWREIFLRDLMRCVCPVCESRSCTNHHCTYQAHGGGDEPENQITVCEFCHLDGEHGGRLRIRGSASNLTWLLGRVPVLKVVGRTKMAA